jgi:hypothetical protein
MSSKKRRVFAKGVLFLYIFISATFSLAHKDYVPLECKRAISSANGISHNLDSSGADFMCPAHNFAQSTTAADVREQSVSSPEAFSFIQILENPQYPARPQLTTSSRAPPQA